MVDLSGIDWNNSRKGSVVQSFSLTPDVLHILLDIANARNRYKSPKQTRRVSSNIDDLSLDYEGVKGEYVVSQVYGVPFDASGYGPSGDSGIDIRTPTTGAVKTNHRTYGYLVVERKSDFDKVEIVHLVDGPCNPPHYCICKDHNPKESQIWSYIGWITVADFWAYAEQKDWGHGIRWFCKQDKLTKTLHPEYLKTQSLRPSC